jgi:hypothetical protein
MLPSPSFSYWPEIPPAIAGDGLKTGPQQHKRQQLSHRGRGLSETLQITIIMYLL